MNSKRKIKYVIVCCILMFNSIGLYAQENGEKAYVTDAFSDKQIINMQSTQIPTGLEFRIQHRFGGLGYNSSIIKNFLGFDLSSNIRFSIAYPIIKNRLQIAIGRTKFGKVWDMQVKYLWLRQTEEKGMPVSVAVYHNTALSTQFMPATIENGFFADSTTVFEYKFAHRLSYVNQIIVSRKFNDKFSFQLAPTIVYQNLAKIGRENLTIVLASGGRFKFSSSGAFIFEYAYIFNNPTEDVINYDRWFYNFPLSMGVEFGSAGHTFQFFVSSSNNILEQKLYTENNYDYLRLGTDKDKPAFSLGFNIRRTWWF